jgi:hypothetical protein
MQSGGGGLLEKKIGGGPHNDRCLPAQRQHTHSRQKLFCLSVVCGSTVFCLVLRHVLTGTGKPVRIKMVSAPATRVLMRKLKLQQIT